MSARLVVVGDALLDRDLDGRAQRLAPDAPVPVVEDLEERPRPGGAGLAAALAAGMGAEVTLICALGDDDAGRRLASLLAGAGVRVCDLGLAGATPEKIRVRAAGRALVRVDRGGESTACGPLTAAGRTALEAADAVLVADYGRGIAAEPSVRDALGSLRGEIPVIWDPHPRGADPVPGVMLATPNAGEAQAFAARAAVARQPPAAFQGPPTADPSAAAFPAPPGADAPAPAGHPPTAGQPAGVVPAPPTADPPAAAMAESPPDDGTADLAVAEACGRALAAAWRAVDVCVTLGARGAVLVGGDGPALALPARAAGGGDPCGAGDCFAAAAAVALAGGALPSEAVHAAVDAASAFVGAGGASGAAERGFAVAPDAREPASAHELARRIRAAGGTVVATGGCFDLLHAGHVRALEAARALGDCLVVCLNSDASVQRLKGPERPLVRQEDRAAVLLGLGCVDAVVVFDEDDPRAILRELKPHLWAKGGDYAATDLPETPVLAEWGGRPVIVPYVAGRSTTRMIQEAVSRVR